MWVDDVVIWAKDVDELLWRLEEVLVTLVDRGLFATAPKTVFFKAEIKWCERLYSGDVRRDTNPQWPTVGFRSTGVSPPWLPCKDLCH